MEKFITQLIVALVKALLSPEVLPSLLALRKAWVTPTMGAASKPDSDDKNFTRMAQTDGWTYPSGKH